MTSQKFTIQQLEDFNIIRDDLFKGGTKKRALEQLIDSYTEKEFVYACDYYGHAAYAIALAAKEKGKSVTLFYYAPKIETGIFKKTTDLPNVTFYIIEQACTQVEVARYAEEYAQKNNAKFFPIGLDYPEFEDELVQVVTSAKLDSAPEIWCIGGSGTLARALQRAYPDIPVYAVSVGTSNAHFEGVAKVYEAPERLKEEAQVTPPYQSSLNYDAKVWRFVLENAQKGAYVWNVA